MMQARPGSIHSLFAILMGVLGVGSGLNTTGCAKGPAMAPVGVSDKPPTIGRKSVASNGNEVAISPETLAACGLHDDPAPQFDISSSDIHLDDGVALRALALCATDGALKDFRLMLVGRSDPRAELTYRGDLARERAEIVRDELVTYGVPAGRVVATAAGTGVQLASATATSADRRVDVLVMP